MITNQLQVVITVVRQVLLLRNDQYWQRPLWPVKLHTNLLHVVGVNVQVTKADHQVPDWPVGMCADQP